MAEAPENQKEEQSSEHIRQEKSKDESTKSAPESREVDTPENASVSGEGETPPEHESAAETASEEDAASDDPTVAADDEAIEAEAEAVKEDVQVGDPDELTTESQEGSGTDDPQTAVSETAVPETEREDSPLGSGESSLPEAGPTEEAGADDSEDGAREKPEKAAGASAVASDEAPKAEEPQDDEEEDEEEDEAPDYSQLSREELFREIEKLAKAEHTKSAFAQARQLKAQFDDLEETDREAALQKFISEGGEAEGFEYRTDTLHEQFYAAYEKIRERRTQQRASREKDRQQNLIAKQEILNKLRDFVDSEETQVSINKLKEIQNEWRSVGEVPPQHNRSLWANYNALLDRFYDNRSIYFELKELDRKKNLEAKTALADRAEQLVEEPDIKKATQELDELHEEYKHIGPVPREEQETLWQRFKAASDKIHERRRENVEVFKEQLEKNLVEKQKLAEEVVAFASYDSDSIKEWNKKTKDIQQLQRRWEAAGSMPRSRAKEVNKQFWSHFKEFFAHKGEFFKRLDAMREENLQKKEALVERAEKLKDSEDWKSTSNELKRLQREWKDIGPVPEKFRESVYQRFKAACDHFFNRRRANSQETEVEYQKNLKAREAICEQIEKLAEEKSSDLDMLEELTEQYSETGFVPRGAMKSISERYQAAVDKFLANAKELDETQKQEVQVSIELGTIKNSPGANRKINQKEGSLRRQISRLEDDISVWKTNITFFTSSKQADKLVAEVERKIEKASAELEQLKTQLDVLQNLREE